MKFSRHTYAKMVPGQRRLCFCKEHQSMRLNAFAALAAQAVESASLQSVLHAKPCSALWHALWRKQDCSGVMETPLRRCFSTFDLSFFGIGNILGGAVYVITGVVIREAGPAGILSMAIAGFAALLISFSYAELASRLPRAGGAYTYTYVIIGELVAFIVGWSVILSNILAFATVSKGWSATLDSMFNYSVSRAMGEAMGMHTKGLSAYPDFVAFGVSIVVCGVVCTGARMSGHVITLMTVVNLLSVVFVTVLMLIYGSMENLTGGPEGFMPYGFGPVMAGSATAFYAFIGFDAAATASEEVRNPARTIPTAMFVTIGVSTLGLVLSALALVCFVPHTQVASTSAFTNALFERGLYWQGVVCGIGGLIGLTASLLCSAYAMPRVVYAIAHDGLIFRALGRVYQRTQVPLNAVVLSAVLISTLALLLDFEMLADFLSLGTLIAYSVVNCDLTALRYVQPAAWMVETATSVPLHPPPPLDRPIPTHLLVTHTQDPENQSPDAPAHPDSKADLPEQIDANGACDHVEPSQPVPTFSEPAVAPADLVKSDAIVLLDAFAPLVTIGRPRSFLYRLPLPKFLLHARPGIVPICALIVFIVCSIIFASLLVKGQPALAAGYWWAVILMIVSVIGIVGSMFLMVSYHQNDFLIKTFKYPYVPYMPCFSILLNLILAVMLDQLTFAFFALWSLLGIIIYLSYGVRHSSENRRQTPASEAPYGAMEQIDEHEPRKLSCTFASDDNMST